MKYPHNKFQHQVPVLTLTTFKADKVLQLNAYYLLATVEKEGGREGGRGGKKREKEKNYRTDTT
jgi:hypothetical protein